ncbi:MAG TPA: polyphosphate polymerase domain-containing protein [Aggregatilineales bacterium]|nr:polyphosphate polymerase domain-containing protein [Aggregatilineales bacterium]
MGRIKSFNRRELKFVIRTDQMQPFLEDLTPYLQRDAHTNAASKTYRITSVYYDSPGYAAYWQKLEGLRHRRKVRIRTYIDRVLKPEDECFVEVKERIELAVRKRRIIIPYGEALSFCSTGYLDPKYETEDDRAVIDEIAQLVYLWQLEAACALRYDRSAFNGHPDYDPSLRITFDTNCRARIHDLDLTSSAPEDMQFFLSPQLCILEIKADDRVPYWLVELMHRHKFILRRISKYCTALENLKVQLQRQTYLMPRVVKEAVPYTSQTTGDGQQALPPAGSRMTAIEPPEGGASTINGSGFVRESDEAVAVPAGGTAINTSAAPPVPVVPLVSVDIDQDSAVN